MFTRDDQAEQRAVCVFQVDVELGANPLTSLAVSANNATDFCACLRGTSL